MNQNLNTRDPNYETSLRPSVLSEFIGHESIRQRLNILIQAAKEREESVGHILLNGPPGLGKTTLASIVAQETQTQLITTSGPAIEKAGDLAGLLTNLDVGDILFIDEIHRLSKVVEEYLYPALEQRMLDIMIDSGPNARSVQIQLKPFTLIGATTRIGDLSAPLRSRFDLPLRLEFYPINDLTKIILRSAKILRIAVEMDAAEYISQCSRGTPRIANNLLKWVRDCAQIEKVKIITMKIAKKALDMLYIDEKGLHEMDKKILEYIIHHHSGGPVGLNTLSAALGENAITLSEVYEPFLIMQGFLKRTPRGRETTLLAKQHLTP